MSPEPLPVSDPLDEYEAWHRGADPYTRYAPPLDPWGSPKLVVCRRCGCVVAHPAKHGEVCAGRGNG